MILQEQFDSLGRLIAMREGTSTVNGAGVRTLIDSTDDHLVVNSYAHHAASRTVVVTSRSTSPRAEADLALTPTDSTDLAYDETHISRSVQNSRGQTLRSGVQIENLKASGAAPAPDKLFGTAFDAGNFFGAGWEPRQNLEYGQHGQVRTALDGKGDNTSYQYDLFSTGTGQVALVTQENHATISRYDSAGNRLIEIQKRTNVDSQSFTNELDSHSEGVISTYDQLGRLTSETELVALKVENSTVITALARKSWTYDGFTTTYKLEQIASDNTKTLISQSVTELDPTARTQTTTFSQGVANNPVDEVRTVTTLNRDRSIASVTETWLAGSTRANDTTTTTISYDEFGRANTTGTSVGLASVGADFASEVAKTYFESGVVAQTTWKLDLDGSGAGAALTSFVTTTATKDSRGRVNGITRTIAGTAADWGANGEPEGLRLSYAYNANGTLEKTTRKNVTGDVLGYTDYVYTATGQLKQLAHRVDVVAGEVTTKYTLASYSNQFNANDRLESSTEELYFRNNGQGDVNDTPYKLLRKEDLYYKYDAKGQLIYQGPKLNVPIADLKESGLEKHDYDAAGNKIDDQSQVGKGHRLLKDAQFVYEYNLAGQVVKKIRFTNTDTWTYAWDSRGRLLSVKFDNDDSKPAHDYRVEFGYDALGQLVSRRQTDLDDGSIPVQNIGYVVENGQRQFELDLAAAAPTIARSFVYDAAGNPTAITQLNHTTWLLSDISGSIRSLADFQAGASGGWRIAHRDFNNFGEQLAIRSNVVDAFNDEVYRSTDKEVLGNEAQLFATVPVSYQGGWWDQDAGLYNLQGHWYDPFNGRFAQDTGRVNPYALSPVAPNQDRVSLPTEMLAGDYGAGIKGIIYRGVGEGFRGALGDEYLAQASDTELALILGGSIAAGFAAGHVAYMGATAYGVGGLGAAALVGGAAGLGDYVGLFATAGALDYAADGQFSINAPTLGGAATATIGGALTAGALYGAGQAVSPLVRSATSYVGAGLATAGTALATSLPNAARQTLYAGVLNSHLFVQTVGYGLRSTGRAEATAAAVMFARPQVAVHALRNEIGYYARVIESMSDRAAIYQSRITGRLPDVGYLVNGVKFDGFNLITGNLLDAKGPGYATFVQNGRFYPWFRGAQDLVQQAQRQVSVARGNSVEWHFAEEAASIATRNLLRSHGITGIQIKYTP